MQFYSHPLIKIISEYSRLNKEALFPLSGMEASIYKKEFQKLINEGHIMDNGEQLYPRCLTIRVNDKQSKRFIKELEIKYVSRDDLNKIVPYNEENEAFIDGLLLTEDQARYFEVENGLMFNYKKSNYRLYVGYANLNYNPLGGLGAYSEAKIPILHLDSYSLLAKGVELCLKNRFVQEFEWNYFSNPAEALVFITDEFSANRYIHFIITDLSLPLWDGYKFAKWVRKIEEKYNYRQTPIIALTMQGEDDPLVVQAMHEGIFAAHFTKDVDCEVLAKYVNTIPLQGGNYATEQQFAKI